MKNRKPLQKRLEQKSLISFNSKQKQSFTKEKILNRHFTEKLPITRMGVNTKRKKEKKSLSTFF